MLGSLQFDLFALFNVILIDVVLAGDNAVVVGLAASRVAPDMRKRVIFWGMIAAVVLRIVFAGVATRLLAIVGLTLAGGILLLWVCWKMYRELRRTSDAPTETGAANLSPLGFGAAVSQIVFADISMSLDNVLAVAGAAKGSPLVLATGLGVAIVLMAVAASYIARLLVRFPWITWIGLLIIVTVALDMIFEGSREVACATWKGMWCAPDLLSLLQTLLGLGA